MLISLWLMAQLVLLALSLALSAQLPQTPAQALLLVVVGAVALTPLIPVAVRALRRALAHAPSAAPGRSPRPRARGAFRLPSDPGVPGAALARAPSPVVRALA